MTKTTNDLFQVIQGFRLFTTFANTAGVSAGIFAEKLAVGLFNTALAIPGVFSKIQQVVTRSLTGIIKTLGLLVIPNTLRLDTIQQGFNGLLLIFSALPVIVHNHVNRASKFLAAGFKPAITSVKAGWQTVVSSAQFAWNQTVTLTKTSALAIANSAKFGFNAVVSSIRSVIVAARGLTILTAIQKTWNATIFVTQSLLRGLRAGLVALFSVNVAGMLSQGIAFIAVQLSMLATTTIPAVVSAVIAGLGGLLPVLATIGAAVGVGVAVWYFFGDAIKSAFTSAMQSAQWFFGWIGSGLQTLWSDVSKYMGMIGGMLASGDIAGAASNLWKLIQLEFAKGSLEVSQQFGSWIDSFYALWNSWSVNISNVIATTVYGFKMVWAEAAAWFQSIWSFTAKLFLGIWNGVASIFGSIWDSINGYVQPIFDWMVAAWNFVIDTMIAAGELLWNAIVDVFKSVFGWIKKFTDWAGLTGGEEEKKRKDELATKRQSARDELEQKITSNESGRKTKDDFSRERDLRNAETEAQIAALESDLEKTKMDFEKSAADRKNAAFGVPAGKEYTDADYAIAKAQKKVLEAQLNAEKAQAEQRDADNFQPKANAVQRATLLNEELRQAKAELAKAEYEKIIAEVEKARKDFDEAAANYESVKNSGDDAKILESKTILAEKSSNLNEANSNYEQISNRGAQEQRDSLTFELDFNVAKARKKISELTLNLETAKSFGDTNLVDKTKKSLEQAKNELASAEYERILQELGSATRAFEDASKKYNENKDSGDPREVMRLQEQLEKTAKRLEDANSGYVSYTEQMKKGSKDAEMKISTTGTFNASAVRGLEGNSTMERVAKASEETAKNTKQMLKQSKSSGAVLTFG